MVFDKNLIWGILGAAIFVTISFVGFFYIGNQNDNRDQLRFSINSDFRQIQAKDSFSGEVFYVVSQSLRSDTPIYRTDIVSYKFDKVWFKMPINPETKENDFYRFIKVGDSIYKSPMSDSVTVFRDSSKFVFPILSQK